tara:strand:- start:386 stop:634 length:249 start_codon:yes stop_codon:yes gene_type:complete
MDKKDEIKILVGALMDMFSPNNERISPTDITTMLMLFRWILELQNEVITQTEYNQRVATWQEQIGVLKDTIINQYKPIDDGE